MSRERQRSLRRAHRTIRASLSAGAVLVALTLGSCDEQQPAVCRDLDTLRSSVDELTTVDISAEGLTEMQGDLERIRSDLRELRNEASDEYSGEIDAVESSIDQLRQSLDAARTDPTASTFADVASDVGAVGSSLGDLDSAIAGTC